MSEDKLLKDNDSEEQQKIMAEWEKHMNDFVPEDINTVIIDPR